MTLKKITVAPVTRIEGHLKFETHMENNRVKDAYCSSEMFRGLEKALVGYDARVAQHVTQRVCGVCPYAHAEAAAIALESAMGIEPNANGKAMRNLITGAYQLHDFIMQFYILSALDFIDITAVLGYKGADSGLLGVRDWVSSEMNSNKVFPATPFLPRYQAAYLQDKEINISAIKNYIEALPIMAELHKMVAIFGGKAPHPVTIEAGGVTTSATVERILSYQTKLAEVDKFIRNQYVPDVIAVAKSFPEYFNEGQGYGNLLSCDSYFDPVSGKSAFVGGTSQNSSYKPLSIDNITEDHTHSYYKNEPSHGVKPLQGSLLSPLNAEEFKKAHQTGDKYSWTRSPRYAGEAMEVGASARIVNTYLSGKNPQLNSLVDKLNGELGIGLEQYHSVMGRHLCRAINSLLMLDLVQHNLDLLSVGKSGFVEAKVPVNTTGFGLVEASRGMLGHWIATDGKGYISKYELVVPTTWNISPRDASGLPGAVEKMLVGTKVADEKNPIELTRIIRSTDPCMACSVH